MSSSRFSRKYRRKDVGRPGCASSAAPNACRASCSVTEPASTRPGSFTRAAAYGWSSTACLPLLSTLSAPVLPSCPGIST